jgi:hypothetical protein
MQWDDIVDGEWRIASEAREIRFGRFPKRSSAVQFSHSF